MPTDPWTDPDPQPGDFDSELERAQSDRIEIHDGHSVLTEHERPIDDREDLERFSAQASRGVLRHMTEGEEKAGLSWEKFRPR